MTSAHRFITPAALQWQDDGELTPQDAFDLVRRLRQVESVQRVNELWRLGQKVPKTPAITTAVAGGVQEPPAS